MSAPIQRDSVEPPYDPSSRLGECIANKWTLEEVLGVGGMAAVYAATHRNGHRTAVKMLLPEITRDVDLVRRFLREGYLANKVPHEGAVRVIDDGRAGDGSPYLVMERLFGHSLDKHAGRTSTVLTMRECIEVMIDVLDILDAAHSVGIVHRDIKPANIFRTTQGEVKLLDFGIALLVESGLKAGATGSGVVIGTPAFMAPEQARGRHELVGPRTDLWAVAASGLCLMIGRRLRPAVTAHEELAMAALQPLPPSSTFHDGLGGRLGEILDRALAFEPEDRFATAAEMRMALAGCRDDVPSVALRIQATPQTASTEPRTVVTPPPHHPPTSRFDRARSTHPSDAPPLPRAPMALTMVLRAPAPSTPSSVSDVEASGVVPSSPVAAVPRRGRIMLPTVVAVVILSMAAVKFTGRAMSTSPAATGRVEAPSPVPGDLSSARSTDGAATLPGAAASAVFPLAAPVPSASELASSTVVPHAKTSTGRSIPAASAPRTGPARPMTSGPPAAPARRPDFMDER